MEVARRRVDETGDVVRRLAADLGEAQTEVICRDINGVFCFSCGRTLRTAEQQHRPGGESA